MPIEMPTIESIKRFVQMGMGVAIVPRMCAQWEIERGWMKEVRVRQLSLPATSTGLSPWRSPSACGGGTHAHPAQRGIICFRPPAKRASSLILRYAARQQAPRAQGMTSGLLYSPSVSFWACGMPRPDHVIAVSTIVSANAPSPKPHSSASCGAWATH